MKKIFPRQNAIFVSITAITSLAGNEMMAQTTNNLDAQRYNERPNIVLVIAEDLSSRWGCFGDHLSTTPNLDALAHEGVRFTNVHTMAGVSGASRSGLITGAFQNFTNLLHMRSNNFPGGGYFAVPPSNVKAYPELLRRAGYYTYCDVKFDYQFSGPSDPGAFTIWDDIETSKGIDRYCPKPIWRDHNMEGKPFFCNFNPQITHETGILRPDDNYPEQYKWVRNAAVQKEELRKMYLKKRHSPKNVSVEPFYQDTKETRKDIAQHYDNIQVMDIQVGDLIRALKTDGLWNNTIFIVTTDHGDCLPRAKREGYDSGTHVPMIVHVPDKYRPEWMPKNGEVCSRLISFEDIPPTILNLAKTTVPEYMHGIDLSKDNPIKRKMIFANRARLDTNIWNGYYIQNEKYQYVRNISDHANGEDNWFRNLTHIQQDLNTAYKNGTLRKEMRSWFEKKPIEEFYDMTKDPYEFHNVINDPAYEKIVQQFRDTLAVWRANGNDMTIVPEAQMRKEMLDANGQQRITASPIVDLDKVDKNIYISSVTEGASIGYSFDNKKWELYTKPFKIPADHKVIYVKAVRYGYRESKPMKFDLTNN